VSRGAAVIPTLEEAETIPQPVASLAYDVVNEIIVAGSSSREREAACLSRH
jgi:hypothetical protein